MKQNLKEEQYSSNINVATFRTREQAESYLEYLRRKYGFSEYNSYINGTTVVVTIEKNIMDDSYYYDMINAIKQEREKQLIQYRQISESRLRKLIREALINEMNANKLSSDIQVKDDRHEEGGTIKITFGKNGWGLTDELIKIGNIVHKLSQRYNIYLDECKIDKLDDVYDFVFHYDNEHFED